ncbi:MAG: DegT/DnrJ/EryC1/StrS family aminotransferase [Candidatus Kapaibacteriota bacterium]
MQFIDLKAQYNRLKADIDQRVLNVLNHGAYVFGPEIAEMEKKLADHAGVKHCLSCASGTDALLIPLMAWGVKPGDAVFVPSFTFISTAEVVSLLGATPIFVEVEEHTFNIDVKHLEVMINRVLAEGKLIPKVIVPVDLFGLTADYSAIEKVAEKYNLLIMEDSAQGFGGKINGKVAGSFGQVSATSFYPAKPLGCYGDGGAIFTNDDELADVMKSIRVHGMSSDRYNNVRIGINGRMDTIQAAVVLGKLEVFVDELDKRNDVANKYKAGITKNVKTPTVPEGYYSSWAQYSVLAESSEMRAKLQDYLKSKNIPSVIYYPIPLHLQTAYAYLGGKRGDLPVTESIADRVFSLPMHPYMTDAEINEVIDAINSFEG